MTKATFVNFFYRSYQVLLTCYYTQVSYTGSWEPLVEFKCALVWYSNISVLHGLHDSASVSCIVYIIYVKLKYWTITSKFEGLYNAGIF
jgi:hypothetical protein